MANGKCEMANGSGCRQAVGLGFALPAVSHGSIDILRAFCGNDQQVEGKNNFKWEMWNGKFEMSGVPFEICHFPWPI